MLSRAARGEGIKCPKCKTFAPLGPGGVCVCTSCGCKIQRVPVGEATVGEPVKVVPRAKVTAPSSNLGRRRSALLAAAQEESPIEVSPQQKVAQPPVPKVEPETDSEDLEDVDVPPEIPDEEDE